MMTRRMHFRVRIFLALLAFFLLPMVTGQGSSDRQFEVVKDTIIVKFKSTIPAFSVNGVEGEVSAGVFAVDELFSRFEIREIRPHFQGIRACPETARRLGLSRIYQIRFPSRFRPEEVAQKFSENPYVEYAQSIGIHPVYATYPDDPHFGNQWALSQGNDCDLDAPEAWDLSQGDSSVILAVPDTGVDWQHPDLGGNSPYLDGNIWINWIEYYGVEGVDDDGNDYIDDIRGWDWVNVAGPVWPGEDGKNADNDPMDFNGHGTHCAGIAGALTDNGTGVAGLGWNCRIMPLRVGWSGKSGSNEVGYVNMGYCAQAIIYAVDMGAAAINCSWGSSNTGGIGNAVDYAVSNGVLVVVAAGNANSSAPAYLNSRGDCIDVAATDQNDVKASFSNYGSWVDVCAPGVSIYSSYFDHDAGDPHTYSYRSGTSMAVPHVVGLIGLIRALNPALTAEEIKTVIYDSCDNIDSENPDYPGLLGSGRVNACSALSALTSSIQGTVTFAYPGWTQDTASIEYQVREPGLPPTEPLYEETITISVTAGNPAAGNFTIPEIPDGTYDVALKHANHLADMVFDVIIAGADVTGLELTLWAGDADGDDNVNTVYPDDPEGDNDVDLMDYYTLYYQYHGGLPVTMGYNGDFDGDGSPIDLQDYYGLYYGYQNNPNPGNWYYP